MTSLHKALLLIACAITLVTEGCTLVRARREMATLSRFATLHGDVRSPSLETKPIVVFLFDEREGKKVARSRYIRYGSGSFHFRIEPQRPAFLFAIEDSNENQAWDDGEPVAWYGGRKPEALILTASQTVDHLTIELRTEVPDGVAELRALEAKGPRGNPEFIQFRNGEIARLDEERFSPENGAKGLWQPLEFVRELGLGIYFLEPYDPERIPVLFVHGAGGTPRQFAEIIAKLDRKRFQPWVFHYPSGIRLGVVGDGLRGQLDDVQTRYRFSRLIIVAHSQGGLVSRACINLLVERGEKQYVSAFVSISTPWQGHELAEAGTKKSPVVIPAWYDLASSSPFLDALLRSRLPSEVPHHLFFSYEGGRGSDGTVSLASELAPRAQEGASGVFGFAEDHETILQSEAMIEKLNTVLHSVDEHQNPGRLALR